MRPPRRPVSTIDLHSRYIDAIIGNRQPEVLRSQLRVSPNIIHSFLLKYTYILVRYYAV